MAGFLIEFSYIAWSAESEERNLLLIKDELLKFVYNDPVFYKKNKILLKLLVKWPIMNLIDKSITCQRGEQIRTEEIRLIFFKNNRLIKAKHSKGCDAKPPA